MAIGTITVTSVEHKAASTPFSMAVVSFAGDDDYPTGGTVDFEGALQTVMGRTVTVLGVIPLDLNGGFDAIFDKAADKLIIKATDTQASLHDDMSLTTFKLGVLYV